MTGRYRCHTCGAVFAAWAPAERHADAERHHRMELILDPTQGGIPMARQADKDPEKRAAKRAAKAEAIARGAVPTAKRRRPTAQMSHASSGKAIKKRRDRGLFSEPLSAAMEGA